MIGMPASVACLRAPLIASALGTETASPSTFWETAAWISCASFCGSLLDGLQISLTPSDLAAASAPFLTTDQNEPSSEWVTIATVRLGASAALDAVVVDDESFLVPSAFLTSPQAAANTARAATINSTRRLWKRLTTQHSPRSEPGSR